MMATIEAAKKVAESVWVVEHARRCRGRNVRLRGPCMVAGCAQARAALDALEGREAQGDQGASSGCESGSDAEAAEADTAAAVKAVLDHRGSCSWADPSRGRGITRRGRACLVCALVSRARAVADPGAPGLLHLDFSERPAGGECKGCFEVPDAAVEGLSRGERRLLMTRSNTTEELALLLSDMQSGKVGGGGRGRANSEDSSVLTSASKPVVSDAEEDGASVAALDLVLARVGDDDDDDAKGSAGAKRPRTASMDDEAVGSPVAAADVERHGHPAAPKAPRISVATTSARLSPTPDDDGATPKGGQPPFDAARRGGGDGPSTPVSPPPSEAGDDDADREEAKGRPPPAGGPADTAVADGGEERPVLVLAPFPLSPRAADAVRAIPRSPSFSAAASSLLGLSASCTKQKPSLSPSKAIAPLATISSLKAC